MWIPSSEMIRLSSSAESAVLLIFSVPIIVHEPKEIPKYEPVDWKALGDNERRCKNCERFRKNEGLGDFICKHMRGYKEAPAHIRRCNDCDMWKKIDGIPGNFWCRHNKFIKKEWDRLNEQGWFNATFIAKDIREHQQLVRNAK